MTAFQRVTDTSPCGDRLVVSPEPMHVALCHHLLVEPKFAMKVDGVVFEGQRQVTLLCSRCRMMLETGGRNGGSV